MNQPTDPVPKGARLLTAMAALAVVTALVSLFAPAPWGPRVAWVAIGIVVLGPPLRLLLAARAWRGPGDRRYLLALAGLAAVFALAALVGR
ncbi:hypothetical protein ER308_09510 [Egibacter rhizosphaerae]|uniref:Uncharacterized protein n=1 Tax=Egibacter rhizosphaerae TaxID=1670831 RepID=A0A411YEW6_9ACTN|nr:hypothetical protein [Egibacter rhizosphaerae]QBI19765.1 hypothetical protein ER308_09510 [Egibacter rhizosphaerae]